MAPLSNTETGSPPSAGAWSTMAGMRLFGLIARKSGLNWSPALISTGRMQYSSPDSSRSIVTLWPFGVGQ